MAHSRKIAVIGLGYVGLPLAVEVAGAGFRVTGYDKSAEKVESVNRGKTRKGNDFVRADNGAADEWSVERKLYWYSAPDTLK